MGASHVPGVVLYELRDRIVNDAADVTRHVNKYVAHRDRDRPSPATWRILNDSIAQAGEHYSTVGRILTGATPSADLYVSPEWRSAFRDLYPRDDGVL